MLRFVVLLAGISAVLGGSIPKRNGILASTGPSDNPIAVTPPNLPGGFIAVDAPPGPFFQDFQPPYPTNAWWSGFTVGNQESIAAGPFPYQVATRASGLVFGISDTREFDGTSIKVPTQLDWSVAFEGIEEVLEKRKALAWDTQTVTVRYFNDAGTTMDAPLVPGSPYLTVTFNNAAVTITSLQADITAFEWVTPGTKAIVTNSGGTYIIYVVGGTIELTQVENTLVSPPGFTGTLRFAKLKEASQEAILDAHSAAIPTGLVFTYAVANDVSTQTWTWDVLGNAADLLLLSWPHHRKALDAPQYVDIDYLTLKGHMKGVLGNQWNLKNDLPTISWFAQNAPQASCVPELSKTLEAEVNALTVMVPGDFYFWGGAFGRAAQLATIAEHIGRNDLVGPVVDILKQSVAYWFDPEHRPAATYETGWGGFINGDGWNNTWVDFGNAYYNDHHFHYGYLLHGAAVIGKNDPAWLQQNLDFFTHVARGIGNPSPLDPHYTVTRCMDFFAGHSWASGIANGAGPRDQESSGEAINGYYGLLLFAQAINHAELIDYSRMLLAIEIAGSKAYWHLYTTNNDPDTPYPEQAFRDLTTVGNVMDTQAGAWLFWGDQATQIAAIQILPLTPIGQYTFDKEWMEGVLPYCQEELDDPTIGDAFKSVIYAAYAKVDPQAAYSSSANLFDWGTGNSASNQLYFVSTQDSAADICNAAEQTPEGVFNIQDVATGLFVNAAGGGLAATSLIDILATKFELAFTPGGGTIKALNNGKFVTASPEGLTPISAIRDTAASYETFRWKVQPDGTYQVTAMVNRGPVSTDANGDLLNNPAVAGSSYRLIPADNTNPAPPPPATGYLRSKGNNNLVVATTADPTLRATATSQAEATQFSFELGEDPSADPPYYIIRSQETDMIVTGDFEGTVPLAALRAEAGAWEYFQIILYQESYILVHVSSGNPTALQADSTLIDNSNTLGAESLWVIE